MNRLDTIRDEADRAAVIRADSHAFAASYAAIGEWFASVGMHNVRVLREGDRPVSMLLRIPMGLFVGPGTCASVPMMGIAAVAVSPENRGNGYARRMMTACVQDVADEGVPLMGLYASTQTLYRQVGFEQAGYLCKYTVPLSRVDARQPGRPRGEGWTVTPIGESLMPAVRECYQRFARLQNGMLDRGSYIWNRVLNFRGVPYHGFGFSRRADEGAPLEAYVFLNQDRQPDGRQNISLTDLVFLNEDAGRRVLAFLADYEMMGHDLTFNGGPTHPATFLLGQQRFKAVVHERSYLRIANAARAIECRPFPSGLAANLTLTLRDEIVKSNDGEWTLRVQNGHGTLTKGLADASATPRLTADIRGLAAMYTGFKSAAELSLLGLVSGEPNALDTASSIFAAPPPAQTDMY